MSESGVKGPVIAVVGPSGVGKDSLMSGLLAADPGLRSMGRVITRKPEAGGEEYLPVNEVEFSGLVAEDHFALHWHAHGFRYGIPRDIEALRIGASGVLVNLSRAVLLQAQATFDDFRVISVTASPEVLAARLAGRGREGVAEVQRRLARASLTLPEGVNQLFEVDNSGTLGEAIAAALVIIRASSGPASRETRTPDHAESG